MAPSTSPPSPVLPFLPVDIVPSNDAKPTLVYQHPRLPPDVDSTHSSTTGPNSSITDQSNLPIALHKSKCACTSHPLDQFVSNHVVSPSYHSFLTALDNIKIAKRIDTT